MISGLVAQWKNHRLDVVLVVVLAAAARVIGIGFGIPFWLVNDELPLIGGALRMLELRSVIPSLHPGPMAILYYPPLLPYLYLVLFLPWLGVRFLVEGLPDMSEFAAGILVDFSGPWLLARLVSAAAGTGTAVIVYKLTIDLFEDRRAALTAALLMATNLHHLMLDHFARVWSPTVFFMWLGLYFCYRILTHGHDSHYRAAGLAAGLGFGINYVGIVVMAPAFLAHVFRVRRLMIDRKLAILSAIAGLAVILFSALFYQNLFRFFGLAYVFGGGPAAGDTLVTGPQRWLGELIFYADIVWRTDPVLAIGGIGGLLVAFRAQPKAFVILTAGTILYMAIVILGRSTDDRYVLPATPLLAVMAGALVAWAGRERRLAACAPILAVLLIAPSALAAAQFDRLLLRPETRVEAKAWLQTHVGPEEGVFVAMRVVSLHQTDAALAFQREFDPESLTYLQRLRLEGRAPSAAAGDVPLNALNQPTTSALSRYTPDELAELLRSRGFRWYVTDNLFESASAKPLDAVMRHRGRLVATFRAGPTASEGPIFNLTNQLARHRWRDLFALERLGPTVEIYRFGF